MHPLGLPHTLSPPLVEEAHDALERSFGLSLASFPLLRAALMREGQALRSELLEFSHALHYKRAPRFRRNLMARVHIGESDVPEVAIVRDLSASGVRLWVDGEHMFDATATEPYLLEVRVPGSRSYVGLQARLVRVAEHRRHRGVELGFTFAESSNDLGLSHLLQLVQRSLRDRESLMPFQTLPAPEEAGMGDIILRDSSAAGQADAPAETDAGPAAEAKPEGQAGTPEGQAGTPEGLAVT